MSPPSQVIAAAKRPDLQRHQPTCAAAVHQRWDSGQTRRKSHGREAAGLATDHCDGLEPAFVALLLLGGALGCWDDLEALVWDRLSALDGQPVGSRGESSLGPLHGLKLASELLGQALVELVGVEVAGLVARIDVVIAVPGAREVGERALDPLTVTGEKLPGALGVHGARSLTSPARGRRELDQLAGSQHDPVLAARLDEPSGELLLVEL